MIMKSTDLRIGNWVTVNHSALTGAVKITGVELEVVRIREYVTVLMDAISPIPLTEEILLKACLSWRNFHDGVIIYEFGKFEFWSQNGGIWLNKDFKEWLPDVNYVHQLQNLYFALTGKELEINL